MSTRGNRRRLPSPKVYYVHWRSTLVKGDEHPLYLVRSEDRDTAVEIVYLLADECDGPEDVYGVTRRSQLSRAEGAAADAEAIQHMRHAIWCREWRDELLAPYCRRLLAVLDQPPPLSVEAAAIYELLVSLPPHRAMTGKEILAAMNERRIPLDQSTLTTRIIPKLKRYGVVSAGKGIGYYIPLGQRPALPPALPTTDGLGRR